MKTSSIQVTLFVFLMSLFAGTSLSASQLVETSISPVDFGINNKWEKLGERKINRKLDRDEIFVTAREGRFSKIKIGVKESAINMHRCVIHFANGSTQEVNIRKNIPAGGTTRVIDINGGKRVIKKIVFWYDTKGLQNKARVVVWGRH